MGDVRRHTDRSAINTRHQIGFVVPEMVEGD